VLSIIVATFSDEGERTKAPGVIAALLTARFVPNFRAPGDGRRNVDATLV
jgi:hypothetical protein